MLYHVHSLRHSPGTRVPALEYLYMSASVGGPTTNLKLNNT